MHIIMMIKISFFFGSWLPKIEDILFIHWIGNLWVYIYTYRITFVSKLFILKIVDG